MKFIDAHAHIYPDEIAMKAAGATAEFYDMEMECDGRFDTLAARGAQAGIENHVILGVAVTPERVTGINNYLMRVVAERPDLLIGFGAMHPDIADVHGELRRIKAGGLKGIKIHADMQEVLLDGDPMIRVFRHLAAENMPAMLHMGDSRYSYSEPQRLARALKAVPDVKVIAAHFGGWSVWGEAWKVLSDFDNVWVDTSSSLYAMTPEEGAKAVRRYRPDRVVFGTDFPMWDPVTERRRFDALPLTEEEREAVGRRNIEAFLARF